MLKKIHYVTLQKLLNQGLSQNQVAKLLGVTKGAISKAITRFALQGSIPNRKEMAEMSLERIKARAVLSWVQANKEKNQHLRIELCESLEKIIQGFVQIQKIIRDNL